MVAGWRFKCDCTRFLGKWAWTMVGVLVTHQSEHCHCLPKCGTPEIYYKGASPLDGSWPYSWLVFIFAVKFNNSVGSISLGWLPLSVWFLDPHVWIILDYRFCRWRHFRDHEGLKKVDLWWENWMVKPMVSTHKTSPQKGTMRPQGRQSRAWWPPRPGPCSGSPWRRGPGQVPSDMEM